MGGPGGSGSAPATGEGEGGKEGGLAVGAVGAGCVLGAAPQGPGGGEAEEEEGGGGGGGREGRGEGQREGGEEGQRQEPQDECCCGCRGDCLWACRRARVCRRCTGAGEGSLRWALEVLSAAQIQKLKDAGVHLHDKPLAQLLEEATQFYSATALPKLVADFGSLELSPVDGRTLVDFMHSRGLLVRSLGSLVSGGQCPGFPAVGTLVPCMPYSSSAGRQHPSLELGR